MNTRTARVHLRAEAFGLQCIWTLSKLSLSMPAWGSAQKQKKPALLSPGNYSANWGYPLDNLDLVHFKGRKSRSRTPHLLQAEMLCTFLRQQKDARVCEKCVYLHVSLSVYVENFQQELILDILLVAVIHFILWWPLASKLLQLGSKQIYCL